MLHQVLLGAAGNGATDWTSYVQTGGTVGLLTIIVIAFLRQWVVPWSAYKAALKDRDYYREIAHRGIDLADRQMTVAEALTERLTASDAAHRSDRLQARADVLRREQRERDDSASD